MFKRVFNFLLVLWAWPSLAMVEVRDPQVRLLPPSVPNTAGYVTLTSTKQDDALLGVQCDGVKKTELHTLLHDNDLVKMRAISAISLPKDQAVSLEQGGHHLMLIGLETPLILGQSVHCELMFQQAQPLNVAFIVTSIDAPTHHHHD